MIIDESGAWKLKSEKSNYPLEGGQYSLFLLPLLEQDYFYFISMVKNHDTASQFYSRFPLKSLLIYPFDSKMEYWANLSLDWIEHSESVSELKSWAEGQDIDWMPQKLKHRFRKVFGNGKYFL